MVFGCVDFVVFVFDYDFVLFFDEFGEFGFEFD